ncbi:HAD family hydrolase [Kitasatospora phosalacinea]|uniref:HAD family hydrolase n=1 Tax=Kitasatospora phosalacinea TaxID=2065 RepID=UPI0035E2E7A6
MTTGKRAFLLDFDGLICDTESAAHRSWAEEYSRYGLPFPAGVWHRMLGNPNGEQLALADMAAKIGTTNMAGVAERRASRKTQLCDQEPLRPGVKKLLEDAAAAEVVLAVVSSSGREWVQHHLTRLGVADYFLTLFTGERTRQHKPHPELYRLALHELRLPARAALAFEDSPVGSTAASAAGVDCVVVPNATSQPWTFGNAIAVLPDLTHFSAEEFAFST